MAKAFNLVLTGRVAAGHTRQAAAAALAKMVRLPEERALEMLAGRETVIKRNLDDAALARYLDALRKTGVEVRGDEIRQAPAAAPAAPAAPPAKPPPIPAPAKAASAPAAPVATETIKCPACGTEQPKRNLCRQCGGDIRRLLAAGSDAMGGAPQEVSSSSQRGDASSMPGRVRVVQDSDTPHPLNAFSFEGRIGRLRYLAYAFPAYLPFVGALIVGGLLGGMGKSMGMFALFTMAGGLATLLLATRIVVLRLHDLNLSGKWVFLPLVPVLAIFTGSPILLIASALILGVGMLALCLWPGGMMSNDYGSAPGPNTTWTIVGAVLFILLSIIGAFSGGSPEDAES